MDSQSGSKMKRRGLKSSHPNSSTFVMSMNCTAKATRINAQVLNPSESRFELRFLQKLSNGAQNTLGTNSEDLKRIVLHESTSQVTILMPPPLPNNLLPISGSLQIDLSADLVVKRLRGVISKTDSALPDFVDQVSKLADILRIKSCKSAITPVTRQHTGEFGFGGVELRGADTKSLGRITDSRVLKGECAIHDPRIAAYGPNNLPFNTNPLLYSVAKKRCESRLIVAVFWGAWNQIYMDSPAMIEVSEEYLECIKSFEFFPETIALKLEKLIYFMFISITPVEIAALMLRVKGSLGGSGLVPHEQLRNHWDLRGYSHCAKQAFHKHGIQRSMKAHSIKLTQKSVKSDSRFLEHVEESRVKSMERMKKFDLLVEEYISFDANLDLIVKEDSFAPNNPVNATKYAVFRRNLRLKADDL